MNEINWNELKDKAHSNAVKHGFWEGKPSDKHFLCLVISELMEAVNAHRRNSLQEYQPTEKKQYSMIVLSTMKTSISEKTLKSM